MNNIINYTDRAKDFGRDPLVPVLDPTGTGDYGQEARQAQIRNEAAESVSQQLNEVDYHEQSQPEQEDKGFFRSWWDNTIDTVEKIPGVGGLVKGIGSLADPWRQANVQGHQVNLDKKYDQLNNTEAKWLPQLEEADRYLNIKQELSDLDADIQLNGNQWSEDQMSAAVSRQTQLYSELANLEPAVRDMARTNPYMQDIFYETNPGKLFSNKENFGSIKDLLKYYTYDYINAKYAADVDPGNNFKHMLEWSGVQDPIFGRIGELSPEQIEYMWNSRNTNDTNTLATQISQIREAMGVAGARKQEQEEDIQAKINTIKKGNLLFDPTKIDPEFKRKFENNEINLSDPMSWYYALPHLGSSYSEFGAMIGQMGASTLLNYAAKGALAATSGGTLPLLYAMTEAGINMSIASYMRDSETSSEAFSAYQEKVLNRADELGIQLPQILNETTSKLASLGYDVDNMTDYELFQASVAQNLQTSDPQYNQILEDSKRGLEVLRETNAALSIPDYLESTMFSYGGNWLSKAYGLRRTLGKTAAGVASAEMAQSVANRELADAGQNIINRTLTRVADKMSKNPMGKVAAKDALNTLTKIGKAAGISYFTERTEEGVQNIVSSRYQQGKYDNVEGYNILNGVANMAQLGMEANLAYYGLHPDNTLNTDKDLHNEMAIGGFTGLFMTGVYGSRDVYQGTRQTLTDMKLRGFTADHYADAEKDAKVEQFISAANESKGGNFGRIRQSLQSLKDYKPSGVTDEMIDEDINLANVVSQYTSNRTLNNIAGELGASYGDTQYKQIIKNAINLRDRLRDQTEASKTSTKNLEDLIGRIRQDETIDPNLDFDANLAIVNYNVLRKLDQELSNRKQDLQQLKKDLELDVNVDGISGIQKYIKEQLQTAKDFVTTTEQDIKLPYQDELEQALAAKYVNDGARADLMLHNAAYVTGRYTGDTRMYKPTWNNLTDEQRQAIITEYANEDDAAGRPARSEAKIREEYDSRVNREWEAEDALADAETTAKRRAISVIQRDLLRRNQKEKEAVQEKLEEQGTPAEEPVVQDPIEETTDISAQADEVQAAVEETIPEPTETMPEIPQDEMTEAPRVAVDEVTDVTEVERLLNTLEQEFSEDIQTPSERVVIEDEIPEVNDEYTDETEDIRVQEEAINNADYNNTEDQVLIEIENNSAEQVTDPQTEINEVEEVPTTNVDDIATEETQDDSENGGAPEPTPIKEEKPVNKPQVQEPQPSPTLTPKVIEEDVPNFLDGTADEVFIDPTTDEVMWDPTGMAEMSNAITVGDETLLFQQDFDLYDNDPSIGPSAFSNQTADVDSRNSIVTKSKQKKAYISNTFFYLPTTDEVMPITIGGKPVEFTSVNNESVTRRPGSELAEMLSTPGWLSTVDDAYYIVTQSTHDMRGGTSAIDNLAVHLIIEKDGKVYNTSLRAISDQLRKDLLALGMNQEEVDNQINNLRSLRQRIIKSYAPNYFADGKLPIKVNKHVKPTNMRISNGTLNNQTDSNGLPIYRKINEVKDFNIPSDSYALSRDIISGDVELAYGTGPFGIDPYVIERLDQSGPTEVQGRGYSGKIYYIPKKENTPSQSVTLPIMLAEELHRIPGVNSPQDLQLSRNVDGTRNVDENGKPIPMSTAELIYELLVNNIFGNGSEFLLGLLANHGSKTVMLGLSDEQKHNFNFLLRKQLHVYTNGVGERVLITGSLRDYSRPQLGYTTRFTKLDKITEAQKRRIVFDISQNIHWNTDKDVLMSAPDANFIQSIINTVREHPEIVKDGAITLFNNQDLRFRLEDLGYRMDENNNPVKIQQEGLDAPIMAAWFINNGKLKTDLGEHAFYAPFVYTDDVRIDKAVQKPVEQPRAAVTTTGETISKQEPAPTKPKQGNRKTPTIAEPATPQNLEKYGLTIPQDQKLLPGYGWGIIDGKTGNKIVTQAPKKFIAGVYSDVRGEGTINPERAKQWLVDTLGIDPTNVIVTNAALRTASDNKVYGVMRVAINRIANELMPQIVLSKDSGEGVQYHEAFHYVSLLLLNDYQRNQVYQEYVNTHSGTENMTRQEVEEALAEEFKSYMLNEENPTLKYKLVKFFKNVRDYIRAFLGKPTLQNRLFRAIQSGQFAKYQIPQGAKEEFYNKYDEGVFYYIPGLSKEQMQNMPNILDADTYYKMVSSLVSTSLSIYNIRSIEDVRKLNIDGMFDTIQTQLDSGWITEENAPLVEDVVTNKDIFKKNILARLEQLGIREVEKVETEENTRLETETGDKPDNTWDKNQGEASKKDNIAFRAKLFFYSVPKYEYTFVKNEDTGVVEKQISPVLDDVFGLPVTEPFNEVWNKIMENMWNIDKYEDIVNTAARLAETDPFFYALHEILTSEETPIDENTKTQLEVTIKSAKIQMNTINVKSDTPNITYDMSDEQRDYETAAALKRSIWEVMDSDNLRKIRRLPSRWSKAFFASNNVLTDDDGKRYINPKSVSYIRARRANIDKTVAKVRKDRRNLQDGELLLQQMKNDFIEICNAIQIPFDELSLNYLLGQIADTNLTTIPQLNKFIAFWDSNYQLENQVGGKATKQLQSFNKGILGDIMLLGSTKASSIKKRAGQGSARTIDRIFNYSSPTAQINLMAVAYGKVHPSPQEFSVTGADGALVYPISENNYMTDQIRNLNQNTHGKREQILSTPYSKRSLIANANGVNFKLHNFLALNIGDTSRDYFGITPVEDYIAKLTLTFNNQMVLPTMSDKKTWYSISGLQLVRDFITSRELNEGDLNYYEMLGQEVPEDFQMFINADRKFSESTLNIFANYWLDEFDAVFDYYAHKDYVASNPTLRVDNYHGKIKNGKMDASGNGGRFRYFSSLRVGDNVINVNEDLANIEANGSTEEVMKYLKDLKVLMFEKENVNTLDEYNRSAPIFSALNNLLVGATNRELAKLLDRGIVGIRNGHYYNKLVPYNIMSYYRKGINKQMYPSNLSYLFEEDVLFSAIGSHVANSALSIIEVEKCFTGDPAYYKWKKFKKDITDDGGNVIASYDVISGRDVDKIKRLSAVLSTGTNLRTIWENPEENNTNISVLHLKDNEIGSEYHSQLLNIFRNSILRDLLSQQHPEYNDNQLIEALSTKEKEEEFYNSLDDEQKKFVDSYSKNSANPYADGQINQSDAAVYIRPALYRKIMKALGQWSDAIEEAYNIMEGDDESWMNDPVKYAKTSAALINPLKMVYFGDHKDDKLNLNIPVFDKMAIFPMFKVLAKADNRLLYDRMNNEELGVIDMLTFESAVKVGGRQKYQTYKDTSNNTFNTEDLMKPSYNVFQQEGNLPVFTQDISNLRLQLNTDPHEHTDRSFGTQAVKICLGNLVDDRIYGENKGKSITGSELKNQVMDAINALSVKGSSEVIKRFYRNGSIDNRQLSEYLISQAVSSGMSNEVIEGFKLDASGEFKVPLAATSSRRWVESRLISYVNKHVVDLNTPGGSAVQMSSFGFKATGARKQSALGFAINDGKKLRFLNEDGSMDVVLSTNFFRHIVPKEFQGSYGQMRKWLLEKGIIGTSSTPVGVGYRIPTQGLSSTFSFKVVDVLPDRIGDTVIVPDEFTAMTGSDFDVDKLYLATLNYDENGKIIQYEVDENGVELPASKQNQKALTNRIIQNYQIAVSDNKNMAETRASIDTLTKLLQNDILPLIQPSVKKEALPMYELLPSFQLARKEEYTGGKAGIAPFALNSTNHCLTQLVHLNMAYSNGNPYGLGQLDEIRGKDGFRILDWLSAMINAHVDVAKDPYIMTLNVNQITYNMTNLLLRGGMGKSAFYFLAQPVLKKFANAMIANKGVYGVDTVTENQIVASLYKEYGTKLRNAISNLSTNKSQWEEIYNGFADEVGLDKITTNSNERAIDRSMTFDDSRLIHSLQSKNEGSVASMYQQLLVLKAYKELSNDAQTLSELVHRSQIDTKKFGNTLAQQMNFRNSYETFITDKGEMFTIRGVDFDQNNPQAALRTYFGQTFLSTKLHHGTSLPRKILKTQVFPATQVYQNIFTSAMGIFGEAKTVTYSNGTEAIAYKHVGDKKFVNQFAQYIDSIIRARLTRSLPALSATDSELVEMLYGSNSMCKRLTGIKQYILENKNNFPSLINQDGTIKNELLNYLQEYPGDGNVQIVDRIVLSDSSLNNDFDTENQLVSAFAELLESEDEAIRDFANDLAKYAYLTSYDETGPNSFFNLVPIDWKIQNGYTSVIKEGLTQFRTSSNKVAYDLIAQENDNAEALYFPSINIAIARNMWWDDQVVTPYSLQLEKGDKILSRSNYTVNGKLTLKTDLFGSSLTRGKEFIKVVNGSGNAKTTELYRLVGTTQYINEEGEPIARGTKYIYQRIPKLGINDNGFKIMEFQKDSLEPSAFPENSFNEKSLLTEGQIEAQALTTLRKPKDANVTIKFMPTNVNSIKVRLQQDAKEIAGIEDGNPVISNVVDVTDASEVVQSNEEFITDEMMQEANEFVYDTFQEQFDPIDAMMDVVQELQEVQDVGNLTEMFDQQVETDIFSEIMLEEDAQDMGALVELGKKRKKECE